MKFFGILIFIVLMFFRISPAGAEGPGFYYLSEYPDYPEIVEHFLSHYDTESLKTEGFQHFTLARKPAGWFLYTMVFNGEDLIISDTIFLWDKRTGFGRQKDLEYNTYNSTLDSITLFKNHDLYNYSIHPFYAYEGWHNDVIDFYSNKDLSLLTSHELYGIGRAYSQAASDIFWPHTEWSTPVSNSKPQRSELKKYIQYSEKAVEYFKLLNEKNPDYNTIVGRIDLKLHNEILAKWYELKIFGFNRQARKFLNKSRKQIDLYTDYWRKYAEKTLNEIEEGAILITFGDNDTYPLLYQQFVKNFRKDVIVINASLLADPIYYQSLTEGNVYEKLRSEISAQEYKRLSDNVIFIISDKNSTKRFGDLRSEMKHQIEITDELSSEESEFYSTFINKEGEFDTIFMKSPHSLYLLPTQFLIMNITDENIEDRAIYFSLSPGQNFLSLFSSANLLRKTLTLELKGKEQLKRDDNMLILFNSYSDLKTLQTISDPPLLPFPEDNANAQKGVLANLMIYEALLIAEVSHGKTLDEITKLTTGFFEKYPLLKCGLNYSYVFLLNILIEEGLTDNFQTHLSSVIKLIEEHAYNTELKDDELYDESELQNLLEMTNILLKNSDDIPEPEREKLLNIDTYLQEKIPLSLNIELK